MNPSTTFAPQESTHVDPCVSDPWVSDDDAEWGAEVPAEAIALDSFVRRLSIAEREIRRAEARRVEIFAEAFDLAALSSRVLKGGRDVADREELPRTSSVEGALQACK